MGAAVMIGVGIFGPAAIKKMGENRAKPAAARSSREKEASSRWAPERLRARTACRRQPAIPPGRSLPDGLKPILGDKVPLAFYRIIADGLIRKLKPGSLTPTYREYETMVTSTAEGLYKELGLTLPDGYVIPPGVPQKWAEAPEFRTMQDYACFKLLIEANRDYIRQILNQLLDNYSIKVVDLLMTRFNAVTANRRPADEKTLLFVRELYGENFIKDYALGHQPVDRHRTVRRQLVFPDKIILRAESDVASLWRTEFTDDELEQVKTFIVQTELRDKLRDDLYHSSLPEAERGLVESTILGYRISSLHNLTVDIVSSYSVRLNDPPGNRLPNKTH